MSKTVLIATTALTLMATPVAAQQVLRSGADMPGTLTKGDQTLESGEFVDRYSFEGRAGQTVTVRMRSGSIDPYLMIRGPGGLSEDNDDAAEGATDAQLTVRLTESGTYTISATTYRPGEMGDYRLSLDVGGNAMPPSTPPARGPSQSPSRSSAEAMLAVGQTVGGELGAGDQTLSSGEYVDVWTLSAGRGDQLVASLQGSGFDSYLMVRGPGGLSEDNDDDPAARGGRDSRIRFTAQADGPITISATSYQSGETGRYSLSVERDGGQGAASRPQPTPSGDTVRLGSIVDGRLEPGDTQLTSGEHADSYVFNGRRGQQLDLRLSSTAFDPYVMITGPDGFSAYNDDDAGSEGSRDSRLLSTLPADGAYTLTATSYEPGESGAYRLSVLDGTGVEPTPQSPGRPGEQAGPSGQIELGQAVAGELRSGGPTLASGEYVDTYRFSGRRGQRIRAELTSSAFDAYIILRSPSGDQQDNDDGQDGTDSVLDTVLAEDGDYEVQVTSYAAGETGSYRLLVAPSRGSPRQVSVEGGPRVFALMVGISDYGGGQSDLPFTDEDAVKMANTLREEGSLNPASLVLTNAEATVDSVRSAFARVAAQAGPEDVFMFFFSGHGGRNSSQTSGVEPDGQSESIILRDGEISDTDMAALFAGLNTRLSLLVLDSCFSGGFARNVVDRPGVMGVFSSEEDLTSAVADKFRAGGYVSHFLREGIAGQADADGDRLVTAGELATYLRRQFVTEVVDVEATTPDGQRNYQNLVIDRGGVQVDDVIVRLPAVE